MTTMYPKAMASGVVSENSSPKTHRELVTIFAKQYGVSESDMVKVITCEVGAEWNTNIQSNIKYNFSASKRGIVKGDRERSYGLAQIHLPDHPQVSIEEATDPVFAINFMAYYFSIGKQSMWSCAKLLGIK